MVTLRNQDLTSAYPGPWDVPLDRLAELGDSVLAHSFALYSQRLAESGTLLSAFNSNI